MPISNGFSQDPNPNPNYYVRKPGKTEYLDESIYYKREVPIEKPVEVVNRPIIKETIFLPDRKVPSPGTNQDAYTVSPDRKVPPLATNRDTYTVAPEPVSTVYTTDADTPKGSFNLIRALGLNADCPCWAWIIIIVGILLLLILVALCLYFILEREQRI